MTEISTKQTKPDWITFRLKWLPVSMKLNRRVPLVLLLLVIALLAAVIISTGYGEYYIAPMDVLRTVLGLETSNPDYELVVRTFRLPRIILALLVGMALAVSGGIMQGITRNDLADPGILGVSAGAGVIVVWYVTTAANPTPQMMSLLSLVGAFTAVFLIYILAWKGGSSSIRLILVGVGIAAVGTALINFWMIRSNIQQAQAALIWLSGSVYGANWEQVGTMFVWTAVLVPLTLFLARSLNLLHLGDDIALGMGARVELARLILIAAAAGLAAASVSVAGIIAFVGFVAPHIARRMVGPSHEGMLLITAVFGALLLVVADFISRALIAPSEIPLGVTTAIIGAPYFAYLLYKNGR